MRIAWAALLLAGSSGFAADRMVSERNAWIPMRDGVRLSANVFRPPEPAHVPAVLIRTPYGKGVTPTANYRAWVNHGYAVVIEDVRGRYGSEGRFKPLIQEPADGSDTIDWIARQPWSDGKVGMIGGSYLGIVQWKVAALNNPHLKAIFPWVSGYDDYRDRFYSPGGAIKLGSRLLWMSENLKAPGFRPDFSKYVFHLPLRTADAAATGQPCDFYQAAMQHPAFDSFWKVISTKEHIGKIRVPVFSVGGWYDNFAESDLEAYAALRRNSGVHRVMIGPWPHNMAIKFPGVDFGLESWVPLRGLEFQWFDQWLRGKDTPLLSKPPVRIFVMGADRWREEHEWPLARTRYTAVYMDSKGHANSLAGDGVLAGHVPRRQASDRYTYDPRDPVPTRGGAVCCNPRVFPWGPLDQRPVEQRSDVLVYTSRAAEDGHRGHRAGPCRDLRCHFGARHGFHRQARGRLSGWRGAHSDRRHPAVALPEVPRKAGACERPGRYIDWRSMPVLRAMSSGKGTGFAWRFRAATSRGSTATRTPAVRLAAKHDCRRSPR